MKRICIIIFTVVSLCLTIQTIASANETGSTDNFKRSIEYKNQFTDVASDNIFAENVKLAYECGIMNGKSDTYFGVSDAMTNEQALYIACRIHSIYKYGRDMAPELYEGTRTEQYCEYLIDEYIRSSDHEFRTRPKELCSRHLFAELLAAALPDKELPEINTVVLNSIPNVQNRVYGKYSAEPVYKLYRAGVLTGNDERGTFNGDAYITRGAACAIATRMIDSSLRKTICLEDELPANKVYYNGAPVVFPGTFKPENFEYAEFVENAISAASMYAKYPAMVKRDSSLIIIDFSDDGEDLVAMGSLLACNAFGVYSKMYYEVTFDSWLPILYSVTTIV